VLGLGYHLPSMASRLGWGCDESARG
jgi:hypothetical protein